MNRILVYFMSTTMILTLFSCTDKVGTNSLFGYDRGKKTLKLDTALFLQKYADTTSGYRYESTNFWGVGTKNSRKTVRKAWLNKDYSLRRTEKTEMKNNDAIITEAVREGDEVIVTRRKGMNVLFEKKTKVSGPVYVELLPQMYVRDIQTKGESVTYAVLNDRNIVITPIEVRFLGSQTLVVNEKERDVNHYQIQVLTSPNEYDNYYVDPDKMQIVQIKFGDIIFKPE